MGERLVVGPGGASWFCGTYGRQFDEIQLDHEPATPRERVWVEVLRTRLRRGGVLYVKSERGDAA